MSLNHSEQGWEKILYILTALSVGTNVIMFICYFFPEFVFGFLRGLIS